MSNKKFNKGDPEILALVEGLHWYGVPSVRGIYAAQAATPSAAIDIVKEGMGIFFEYQLPEEDEIYEDEVYMMDGAPTVKLGLVKVTKADIRNATQGAAKQQRHQKKERP